MDGALIVDKAKGITSHDVVAAARRLLREKRIGHGGTLDPLATGVLVLLCGRATRLSRFIMASDKTYEARIVFGVTTDTYDVTGAVTSRSSTAPAVEDVERALGKRALVRVGVPFAVLDTIAIGVEAYGRLRNKAVMLTREKMKVVRQSWVCGIDETIADLGWKPEVMWREGTKLTADWYRRERWI